jgi:hypothetical protein
MLSIIVSFHHAAAAAVEVDGSISWWGRKAINNSDRFAQRARQPITTTTVIVAIEMKN